MKKTFIRRTQMERKRVTPKAHQVCCFSSEIKRTKMLTFSFSFLYFSFLTALSELVEQYQIVRRDLAQSLELWDSGNILLLRLIGTPLYLLASLNTSFLFSSPHSLRHLPSLVLPLTLYHRFVV